ncbi:hypothetical protein ACOME3_007417 [Neoechinorhynchus agilis]
MDSNVLMPSRSSRLGEWVREYDQNTKVQFEKPFKFSGSKAAKHDSLDTFVSGRHAAPYALPIRVVSFAFFILYFGYLREENDIDERMKLPPHRSAIGKQYRQMITEHYLREGFSLDEIHEMMKKMG